MKRLYLIIITVFLMTTVSLSLFAMKFDEKVWGTCTGDEVNVREGKGFNYKVVTQLGKGEEVLILEVEKNSAGNMAILKKAIRIKVKRKKYTLGKGKALIITEDKGKKIEAIVSYKEKKFKIKIKKSLIMDIGGYAKVETKDGITGWTVLKYLKFEYPDSKKMFITVKKIFDTSRSVLLVPNKQAISDKKYEKRKPLSLFLHAKRQTKISWKAKWKTIPHTFILTEPGYYWIYITNETADELNQKAMEKKYWPSYHSEFKLIKFEEGKKIDIQDYKTQIDGDGMCEFSCPYFYVYDKRKDEYIKSGEIIKDLKGKQLESIQETVIKPMVSKSKKIKILIQEEKDEVSYIDFIALKVNGKLILPAGDAKVIQKISLRDSKYWIMKKGNRILLEFDLSDIKKINEIKLISAGYYEFNK